MTEPLTETSPMVQVVENRSVLSGRVERVEPLGEAAAVTLRVERAGPVAGFPNLLEATVGESITLNVPAGAGDATPQPGEHIRCLARAAGPRRYFALPGSVESG